MAQGLLVTTLATQHLVKHLWKDARPYSMAAVQKALVVLASVAMAGLKLAAMLGR